MFELPEVGTRNVHYVGEDKNQSDEPKWREREEIRIKGTKSK